MSVTVTEISQLGMSITEISQSVMSVGVTEILNVVWYPLVVRSNFSLHHLHPESKNSEKQQQRQEQKVKKHVIGSMFDVGSTGVVWFDWLKVPGFTRPEESIKKCMHHTHTIHPR